MRAVAEPRFYSLEEFIEELPQLLRSFQVPVAVAPGGPLSPAPPRPLMADHDVEGVTLLAVEGDEVGRAVAPGPASGNGGVGLLVRPHLGKEGKQLTDLLIVLD